VLPKPKYQVRLIEKDNKHFYQVTKKDGSQETYPGVTGILDIIGGDKTQRLMGWAKKEALNSVANSLKEFQNSPVTVTQEWIDGVIKKARMRPKKILDTASNFGTRLHSAIDSIILGVKPVIDEDISPCLNEFMNWKANNRIEFVSGDTPVASIKHGYGGKLDAIGKIGKDIVLVDWKSARGAWDTMGLQVAGYSLALKEQYGIKASKLMIVRLIKELPYGVEESIVPDIKVSQEAFLAAKELSRLMKQEHIRKVAHEQPV